jgi:hypothetical protein
VQDRVMTPKFQALLDRAEILACIDFAGRAERG